MGISNGSDRQIKNKIMVINLTNTSNSKSTQENCLKNLIDIVLLIIKIIKIIINSINTSNLEGNVENFENGPKWKATSFLLESNNDSIHQTRRQPKKCLKCERLKNKTRSPKTLQEQLEESQSKNATQQKINNTSPKKLEEIETTAKSTSFNLEKNTSMLYEPNNVSQLVPIELGDTISDITTNSIGQESKANESVITNTLVSNMDENLSDSNKNEDFNNQNFGDNQKVGERGQDVLQSSKAKVEIHRIELLHHLLTIHNILPLRISRRRLQF